MGIDTERDIEANMQIGPTDKGMVRIFIEAQGFEVPMDFDPEEADEIVLAVASRLKTLWHMQDLFPHVGITQSRAFAACYRLVARKQLWADLDHVLWEWSRIEVAA